MDRIAAGGMAEIFRAFTYEDGHQRDVAVKQLLPQQLQDPRFLVMMTDEFRLLSRLRHPNIAEVFELVEVGDVVLIAMEYVDGKDLRSTIARLRKARRRFGFDEVAYLMARALDGLHHAHEARGPEGDHLGLVHRDFNPANILIGYDGSIKLIDFGIAKATSNETKTRVGIIKGKVKYMSPEQTRGVPLDRRSDVFSAGSVLYELATGRPPFDGGNDLRLLKVVRTAQTIPPRQLDPRVPEELEAIIGRAMRVDPEQRTPSALVMRDELFRYLRAQHPEFRRTRLARRMKDVWADTIDAELRSLEEYVADIPEAGVDYGRNLLADALGPEATFAKFSALPTRIGAEPDAR